jgi:hypothetical protein
VALVPAPTRLRHERIDLGVTGRWERGRGLTSAAAWDQPVAGAGRRSTDEEEVQAVSDRLLPRRHAEVQTEEGKLSLFVAIDRTSKFA